MTPRSETSVSMLWTSAELASAERCRLETDSRGASLSGRVVLPLGGAPAQIDYVVALDAAGRTRAVDVDVDGDHPWSTHMQIDEAAWSIDGARRSDLDGCVDVDLGWTPATNTLPIRRLGLAVGESAEITAAWLRFPELVLVPSRQRYVREGPTTWRYVAGEHDFVLETNEDELVTRYGDNLWIARAAGSR